jgi:hypothetical protein
MEKRGGKSGASVPLNISIQFVQNLYNTTNRHVNIKNIPDAWCGSVLKVKGFPRFLTMPTSGESTNPDSR